MFPKAQIIADGDTTTTSSLEIMFIQHEEGRYRPNGSIEMIYEGRALTLSLRDFALSGLMKNPKALKGRHT